MLVTFSAQTLSRRHAGFWRARKNIENFAVCKQRFLLKVGERLHNFGQLRISLECLQYFYNFQTSVWIESGVRLERNVQMCLHRKLIHMKTSHDARHNIVLIAAVICTWVPGENWSPNPIDASVAPHSSNKVTDWSVTPSPRYERDVCEKRGVQQLDQKITSHKL